MASPPLAHILAVDDEKAILRGLAKTFAAGPYRVTTLESAEPALSVIGEEPVDVVLTDIRMPHMSGLELLKRIKEQHPDIEVIVMTAFATVETALEAVKAGAFDYLTKPFESIDKVAHVVDLALERRRLVRRTRDLERELAGHQRFSTIIGDTPAMREVYSLIESVAPTPANVLIRGETGTGKELVAKAIHQRSGRADKKLVTINCSALTETLLESELFGHKKGSFSGATADKPGLFKSADGGTLFLDELGDMSLATQVKLLRALQEGEVRPIGAQETIHVDVRVVAATHVDLETAMKEGRFREDLYWRLNVIALELPPLRERVDDIPLLAQSFLSAAAEQFGKAGLTSIAPAALEALRSHSWEGNVRELQNVIERAVVLCRGDEIDLEHLPDRIRGTNGSRPAPPPAAAGEDTGALLALPFREAKDMVVTSFERRYVEGLLHETQGNVSDAARRADLDRSNFRRVAQKHGIDPAAFKPETV